MSSRFVSDSSPDLKRECILSAAILDRYQTHILFICDIISRDKLVICHFKIKI